MNTTTVRRIRQDPRDPHFFTDPYAAYVDWHAGAPTFFWEDYGMLCVGGFDAVNRLLRDRRLGRRRQAPQDGPSRSHLADFDAVEAHSLLELEPPEHTRLRGLVNRAFVSRQIERLKPDIESLANDLIDAFPAHGPIDLIASYASPLPVAIIAGMLGLPRESAPELLAWSHAMVAMYVRGPSAAQQNAANRAASDFADFLRREIAVRRRRPGDDLLSHLVTARVGDAALDESEIVSSAVLLLNAGHEATVHQTGNAVTALLRQGGDPRRFFADPATAAATVEESLRFDPPLHMFTRYVYEPVDLGGGLVLRPGEQIGLLLGMANRDPSAFARPERFDPGRPDQKTVAFGAGIHFCVGAPLARLELQVSLKILIDRLPDLRLAAEPIVADSFHFRGLKSLSVER